MELQEELLENNTIYHFTSSKIAFENILPSGKLKFSSFQNTDDPYEYRMLLLGSKYWGVRNWESAKIGINIVQETIANYRSNKFQIACFTKNSPDNKLEIEEFSKPTFQLGCTNSRMWSQYGDGHRGVVFAFDSQLLYNEFAKSIDKTKILRDEVNYSYFNIATLPNIDGNKLEKSTLDDYSFDFLREHAKTLFFTKNLDYKGEDEYRFAIFSNGKLLFLKFGKALKAIIVGDRFPDGQFPNLKFYADSYSIPFKKMHWENGIPFLLDYDPEIMI